MRSVRCDACGTKALMAASTCPKCGHGFEVRDNFGELLPLAHCTSCDSYYPEHIGSCRWCGTKPERSPIGPLGPHIWKGVGILVFASLAIGAWLAKNDAPSPPTPARSFVADTLPTNQPKPETVGRKIALAEPETAAVARTDSSAVADSTHDTAIALATVDTLPSASTPVVQRTRVAVQSAGTVAPADLPPTVDAAPADPTPPARRVAASPRAVDPAPPPEPNGAVEKPVVRASEKTSARSVAKSPAPAASTKTVRSKARATAPPPRVVAKAPPRPSTTRVAPAPKTSARSSSGRWVTSIARNWAVVRSDPTRQSRIIAAIGPNTRVQLGETRGEWRRIKAKGLAGWVEHRRLVSQVVMPARTGRLAAR